MSAMITRRKTVKRTVGRPPKSHAEDRGTRAAILAGARSVFARRGFEGTSTREVAEAAGLNNAMIYYYFKDKVELYRAVLADSFLEMDRIWEHPVFHSDASARQKIGKYVEETVRFQQTNEELRRILSMEFAACGANSKWLADQFFRHAYQKLAGILNRGMRSGELKRFDPAVALCSLIGMIVHTFMLRPVAEYITGRKLNLTAKKFGAFVSGVFFDGLSTNRTGTPDKSNGGRTP